MASECTDGWSVEKKRAPVAILKPIPHLLVLDYLIISAVAVSSKRRTSIFFISASDSESNNRFLITCRQQFLFVSYFSRGFRAQTNTISL